MERSCGFGEKKWYEVLCCETMFLLSHNYILFCLVFYFVVAECKNRWKSLRDYANRAKNRPTGSQSDGSSSSGGELLRRLNFLQEATHHRETVSNIIPTPSPAPTTSTFDDEYDSEPPFSPIDPSELYGGGAAGPQSKEGSQVNDGASTSTGRSTKRRRGDKEFEEFMLTQNKKLDLFENLLKPSEPETDDLTAFFKSMEIATRKLPLALQLKVKRGISTSVWDAQEENNLIENNVMQMFIVDET